MTQVGSAMLGRKRRYIFGMNEGLAAPRLRRRIRPRRTLVALLAGCWTVCWGGLWGAVWVHTRENPTIFGRPYSLEFLPSQWAIFYHVYLPSQGYKRALRIVQEQVEQMSQSIHLGNHTFPTTLYLTTIGSKPLEVGRHSLEQCRTNPALQCRYRQHLAQGDEVVTLQSLYEYCQQAGPDQLVTYIHSKGTYHPKKVNEIWRPHLTQAALHPDCVRHTQEGHCNVCGLHFYAQWTSFFPGNMFTARCDHVQQLVPPKQFAQRQEQAVARLLWLRHRGVLVSRLFSDRLDYFGLDRYSMEHWIGSHPALKPCDVATKPLATFLKGRATNADYGWAVAPRHVGPPADIPSPEVLHFLHNNATERQKELFYLPGRLRLWNLLYKAVPPPDSWVWEAFPDGAHWQARREQYDSLSDRKVYEPPGSIFPKSFEARVIASTSPVLFLVNISAYTWDSRSFFSSLGFGARWKEHVVDDVLPPSSMSAENVYKGETLERIYNYCQQENAAPSDIVMYISKVDDEQAKKLWPCLQFMRDGKCNVCGSSVSTGGVLHAEGSNWVSTCAYISKLIRPSEYVVAMNRVSSMAWVEQLKDRFTDVPESPVCLGIDSYAFQTWITSHPDFMPCNVPMEPRGAPACLHGVDMSDEEQKNARLRSYSFLAGHLWRWNIMYGQSPNTSSWVWNAYPDGNLWREATQKYGVGSVVDKITGPLAETSV